MFVVVVDFSSLTFEVDLLNHDIICFKKFELPLYLIRSLLIGLVDSLGLLTESLSITIRLINKYLEILNICVENQLSLVHSHK